MKDPIPSGTVLLASNPAQEFTRRLALMWTQAELPGPHLYLFLDYLVITGDLLLDVGDRTQTETIVTAVLAQAVALAKTSAWVEQEFRFEAMVSLSFIDRAEFLRLELNGMASLDDTDLDAVFDKFNERAHRFTPTNP